MTSFDRSSVTSRVHLRALSRLHPIHQEIASGRCPTAGRLAELLERSKRTVLRDLKELRNGFNAPLHYDRAKRGWRYRDPGWEFQARITEGDLLAFFAAEHALRAVGHTPEATLMRAGLAKLAVLLPEEVSINLNALGEALTSQATPHVMVEAATLAALGRAVIERRTVSFDYHSQHRNEHTHREANVLLLHNFAGDWYAIAYDHLRGEVRDFHAGRISRLRETNKYFDPPENWNKEGYLRRGFQMMRGGRLIKVSIVFDDYQARWMRERIAFHPEEDREELPNGTLRLSFSIGRNGLEAVARFCLAYAGHCWVERPTALRKMIREKLTQALKQHSED